MTGKGSSQTGVLIATAVLLMIAGMRTVLATENPFPQSVFPPPSGEFVTPAVSNVVYAGDLVIRDLRLHGFTDGIDLPGSGSSTTHTFGARAEFDLSTDGGTTFSGVWAHARASVLVRHNRDDGGVRWFDTEMLQLDVFGGRLPAMLLIRESPSLPSPGVCSVRAGGSGYMMDSFFDIFTEISINNGFTWRVATTPAHAALRTDSSTTPPVPVPTRLLFPSPESFGMRHGGETRYAGGLVIRDIEWRGGTNSYSPPSTGTPQIQLYSLVVNLQISIDGGVTFVHRRAPAVAQVAVLRSVAPDPVETFDTEMLQLDISGGDLPPLVLVRESPTLASRGGVTMELMQGGNYRLSSFFDIYTEISVDGGATWAPGNAPTRVTIVSPAEEVPSSTPNQPCRDGRNVGGEKAPAQFTGGLALRNVIESAFSTNYPPPLPGFSDIHSYSSALSLELSNDGGATYNACTATVTATFLITGSQDDGSTRYFSTEMFGFNAGGGTLPAGVLIRESPTLPSTGRTAIRTAGSYRVDSFFDIFFEVSTDWGATWHPGISGPCTLALVATGTAACAESGIDLWVTPQNFGTYFDFASNPIPADFFGPGSDPFSGRITFQGTPLTTPGFGYTDTIVRRGAPVRAAQGGSDTVPIEIVALSLVSCNPITVTYGANVTQKWDVRAFLSGVLPQSTGSMTVVRNPCGDGGTFDAVLPVTPRLVFSNAPLEQTRILDNGKARILETPKGHWSDSAPPGVSLCNAQPGAMVDHDGDPQTPMHGPLPGTTANFHPGIRVDRCGPGDCDDTTLVRMRMTVTGGPDSEHDLLPCHALLPDTDGDGLPDAADNWPAQANFKQEDVDDDGVGDFCDNWPFNSNPCQEALETEIDDFVYSLAKLRLRLPNGGTETIVLAGPTTIHAGISPAGGSGDADGDGLDETRDTIVFADLRGTGPTFGPVHVTVDPRGPSAGLIEERANASPGMLDLRPFSGGGVADSFFDVFFDIAVGQGGFRQEGPMTLLTPVTFKPAGPGETFTNRIVTASPCGPLIEPDNGHGTATQPFAHGNCTSTSEVILIVDGLALGDTIRMTPTQTFFHALNIMDDHEVTNGEDVMYMSRLELNAAGTAGLTGLVRRMVMDVSCLSHHGPRTPWNPVQSFDTEMTQMQGQLLGDPDFDLLRITGGSAFGLPSPGHTTFTQRPGGSWGVDSFFDITYRVDFVGAPGGRLAGRSGSTTATIRMVAGRDCTRQSEVELLNRNGEPTGTFLQEEHYTPDPFVEIDTFLHSELLFYIRHAESGLEPVVVSGPVTILVRVPPEGTAADTDWNGRDQVPTEMIAMDLRGTSSVGIVQVMLDPATAPSTGMIEERVNNTPGILDVAPFTLTGAADSFFDIWYQVIITGVVMRTGAPVHIEGLITHKPPAEGELHGNPGGTFLDLFAAGGVQTGWKGYWDLTLFQSPTNCGLPVLVMQTNGAAKVAWPAPCDCVLEKSTNLMDAAEWRPQSGPYWVTNGSHFLMIAPTNREAFFRLKGLR